MKKIFSLILVVAMLSTVCMAASVGLDSANVSTDGTSAINVVFKVSENFTTAYATAMVYYNKDAWTLSALGSDLAGASVTDDAANGIVNFMVMSVANATEGGAFIKFTATPKADVDVDGETFRLNSLTILDETGTGVIEDGTGADIVLTVEKAAAVEYEDKDIVTRVVADKSDIELADVKYTNVAKYVGTIDFDAIKAAFTGDEALNNEAGIMVNGVKKYQFPSISAESAGSVTYSVLFYGITPAEADALNISTYYNAHVVKD